MIFTVLLKFYFAVNVYFIVIIVVLMTQRRFSFVMELITDLCADNVIGSSYKVADQILT